MPTVPSCTTILVIDDQPDVAEQEMIIKEVVPGELKSLVTQALTLSMFGSRQAVHRLRSLNPRNPWGHYVSISYNCTRVHRYGLVKYAGEARYKGKLRLGGIGGWSWSNREWSGPTLSLGALTMPGRRLALVDKQWD